MTKLFIGYEKASRLALRVLAIVGRFLADATQLRP